MVREPIGYGGVMIGNPLFTYLPVRFQWTIHNVLGHPLSEIMFQVGLHHLSVWFHDWTMPAHIP